jgi:hypothetical protein
VRVELSEQQRGQLDPDCFYGCASAATYFLYQDAKALSATIQVGHLLRLINSRAGRARLPRLAHHESPVVPVMEVMRVY